MLILIMLLLLSLAVITLSAPAWRSSGNAVSTLLALCVAALCVYSVVMRSRGH